MSVIPLVFLPHAYNSSWGDSYYEFKGEIMGHLLNGEWKSGNVVTSDDKGEFKREESKFRSFISDDSEFKPEANRYHLYVSYACPWAHRTLITRKLLNLEDIITVSVVSPDMLEHSWTFDTDFEGSTGDTAENKKYLYDVYREHDPSVTCKVTVPVLWDKKFKKIVNNESAEIIKIFNSAFRRFVDTNFDIYPKELQNEIDEINKLVYSDLNNGVYKTGFAKNQETYEKNCLAVFDCLDFLERQLDGQDFLVGNQFTEADIKLLTTLIRFDAVYHTHFKCSKKRILDYKNLSTYLSRMYSRPEIFETTNFEHIKRHYFYSHEFLNPNRIVPIGPDILIS